MVVASVASMVAWSPVLGDARADSVVTVVSMVSAVSVDDAQLTRAMQRIDRAMQDIRFMMFRSPPVTPEHHFKTRSRSIAEDGRVRAWKRRAWFQPASPVEGAG
jgi:hypothetical protein